MIQKAFIVEDETINTQVLVKMLSRYPGIEIVGDAKNREEALDFLKTCMPDVIFLDVLLPDGSGFDILPYVDGKTHIIFTTGHGNYAVQAFEINAVDYLLKPFSHERLAMAIRKMERMRLMEKQEAGKGPEFRIKVDQLLIKTESEHRFVQFSDILSVIPEGGNYTSVQYSHRKPAIVRKTLKEWADALPPEVFRRVHRGCIVNTSKISRLVNDSGGHRLYIEGIKQPYPVSRRHVADIKSVMKSSG